MTTVVALRDAARAGAWLASDRQVTGGHMRVSTDTAKWTLAPGCALGLCGDGGLVTAIREGAHELDPRWTALDALRFVRARLVGAGAVPRIEPGQAPWFDLSFVWVAPGRVDKVSTNGDVNGCTDGTLAAIGSGAGFAEGAAFALAQRGATPEEIVRNAVEAACRFDLFSGGEPVVTFLPDALALRAAA